MSTTNRRPTPFPIMLAAGLLLLPACGKTARTDGPSVDAGLAGLLDEPPAAQIAADDAGTDPEPVAPSDAELQAMIDQQAAELSQALAQGADPHPDTAIDDPSAPDVSLSHLLEESEAAPAESDPAPEDDAEADPAESVLGLEDLYTKLDEALGRELGSTSEPFRVAVVSIALAAGQGKDPAGAIAEGTATGDALSPDERTSALAIANLLGSLLSAESEGEDRAAVLRQFGEQLGSTVGLQIPTAKLCTRVRGFGKYEEFGSTSFLAGRTVRALVYVEVDQFEHGLADSTSLGGLEVEERWSIELSQTLELYHDADTPILAWKRPEEVVLETSRNKQRDFYLMTEISLPQTLTVGSYKLKVLIRDRVGGQQAAAFIPIKVVADPALAWTPD